MATTSTTLGAACGRSDLIITVAATTGFDVGRLIQIEGEFMTQTGNAVGLQIPVLRGQLGSSQVPHDSSTAVTVGLKSDFPAAQTDITTYLAKTNIVLDRNTPAALGITAVGDGTGDVVGPASATDDRITTFDGATGKLIQDGGKTIATVITDAVTAAQVAIGNSVVGVASGYKIARSAAPVAVTGTSDIDTGLAAVISVTVTASSDLDGDTLAGVSGVITGAAGHFTAKCWKVTTGGAAGNPTLIAADAAKNVNWIAIGT